jgi:carotenoid 1,2-hydratase
VIAFLGSVFSPYYAWARRRGPADPLAHAAINVALYGHGGRRWTMTERGAGHVVRDASSLRIGPSSLAWDGRTLTIAIDEITAPWPRRVRGTIRVTPSALHDERFALDAAARHHWCPIAPCARVEVDLSQPRSRWQGHAYLDSNEGAVPLERDFVRWHWSRARTEDGGTAVLYDIARRDGSARSLALRFHPDADRAVPFDAPPRAALPASGWRVARETRSDAGSVAQVRTSLEDGPFYARSVVDTRLSGQPATAVHESLDLDRFAAPWVQAMLPFRMPRRG